MTQVSRGNDGPQRARTVSDERRPGRAEHYLTDPSKEPDPAKWEVSVAT